MRTIALLAAASAFALTGCASITQGTQQYVSFVVQPSSAYCTVSRDEGEIGTINAQQRSLVISRDKDPLVVECRAPGYADKVMRVHSSAEGRGVTSFWFLDLGLTDLATGAMWGYPSPVAVTMIPLEGPGQAAPARSAAATSGARQSARVGTWSHELERSADGRACHAGGVAELLQTAPGVEIYSMTCANGSTVVWRCSSGACSVMR